MPKTLMRFIAIVLIPSLIVESVVATSAFPTHFTETQVALKIAIFDQQAVNPSLINFTGGMPNSTVRVKEFRSVTELIRSQELGEGGDALAAVSLDGLKHTERIAAAVFPRLETVRATFNESTSVTAITDAALTIKQLKALGLIAKNYRLDVSEIKRVLSRLKEWDNVSDDWNLVSALQEAELFPEGYTLSDDFLRALAENNGDAQIAFLERLLETGTIPVEAAVRVGLEDVFLAKANDYASRVKDEAYEGLCVLRQKKAATFVFTEKALKEFLTPSRYGTAYERKESDTSSLRRLAIAAYYGLIEKKWLNEIDLTAGLKNFAVNGQLPMDAVLPAIHLARQGLLDEKGMADLGVVPKLTSLLVAEDTSTRAYAAAQLAILKKAGLLPSLEIGRDIVDELLACKKAKHSNYADSGDQSGAASLRALESLIEAGLVVPGNALPGVHFFRPYSQLIVPKLMGILGRFYSPLEAEVAARILRRMLADGDITLDSNRVRFKGLTEDWEAEQYGAQDIRNNLVREISHPIHNWLDHCRVPARTWQTLHGTGMLAGTSRDKEAQMLDALLKNFSEGYRDARASFVETLVTLRETLALHSLAELDAYFTQLPSLGSELDSMTAEKILHLVKARVHAGANADESFLSVRDVIDRLSGEDAARVEALRHLLHTIDFLSEQGSEAAKEYLKEPLNADARAARDKDVVDAILAKAELAQFAAVREAAEHLVRCRIYGEGSAEPAANFLRVLSQTEPGFAYSAFNAVMSTNHVAFANFEPVRTLFERIQDITSNSKYSRCRNDAYSALESMARRGVLTADNLPTVRQLFIPDNYTTAFYGYTHVPRNSYFPALLALTEKGILNDTTLDTVTRLFADVIAHEYSDNIDAAASKILDLANAGALTRDNLIPLVTVFYQNEKARDLLLKSNAAWEWEELSEERIALAIAAGPMAHIALEHLARLTSRHYDKGNPEPFRHYLQTVGHILAQVRQRQPQATANDAFDEDEQAPLTEFLMTRYFEPHRLRAVFDIYFNSNDTDVQKHIDDYALKFSKKNPAAFYSEMDASSRLVHRRQERKLDYHFFIPFTVNLMEKDGTLAPQAELFFKLFTSKKLHQSRTLKTLARMKADLLDVGTTPETVAHFRKALQMLDRRWMLAAAKGKELDERVNTPDGSQEYFSFLAAREFIDLLALFLDMDTARRNSVGLDVLARDFALEWRPRIMKAVDALIAAQGSEVALRIFEFRIAADQFNFFYKKNKLGVLYDLFSPHVSERSEEKRQNIRELIRYATSLPANQDGKTLFDIIVDFLRTNTNRPEVVRVLHQALIEESRGTFQSWRYQSSDYQRLFDKYLSVHKNSEEALRSVARIKTAWQTNRYYVFRGPGGANYYLGFTDDLSIMMNLGNPYYFDSCQATYRPGYNQGLSGYVANGWNKALVVFDEKGTFVARRLVRLRISSDGEVVLLRERTYGSRTHDDQLNELLSTIAADAGVRFQPDRGYASFTLQLPLWEGRSPWDYSDTFGDQFTQNAGLIYTAGRNQPLMAKVTVPLAQGTASDMGLVAVDEEFFRLIANHVYSVPAAPAPDSFVSSVPLAEFVEVEGVVYFRGAPVFPLAPGVSFDDTYRPVPDAHSERYGPIYHKTTDNQLYMQPALMTLPRNLPYVHAALASVAATTAGFLAGGLFQWVSDAHAIRKMRTSA